MPDNPLLFRDTQMGQLHIGYTNTVNFIGVLPTYNYIDVIKWSSLGQPKYHIQLPQVLHKLCILVGDAKVRMFQPMLQ
jgi:hypothetical protein